MPRGAKSTSSSRSRRQKDPARALLLDRVGASSSLAQSLLRELLSLTSDVSPLFLRFIPAIPDVDPTSIIARRLYVALLSRSFLLRSVGASSLSSVAWDERLPLSDWNWLDAIADRLPYDKLDDVISHWMEEQKAGPLIDPFLALQENIIPTAWRKRWGEFYTPEWLADYVVRSVWHEGERWLDPTAGAGAFALALARQSRSQNVPFPEFVAFERDPWSLLSAASAIAWGRCWHGSPSHEPLRVGMVDLIHDEEHLKSLPSFDRVVGNPPWVLWDVFDNTQRQAMLDCWRHYGLQIESGMASILGGGKRDVAFLILAIAADRCLETNGRLALVLPQSTFKSTTSARGLRHWKLPDGTPLKVEQVDDLSLLQPFPGASVKTAVVCIAKGSPTAYPVRYRVWTTMEEAAVTIHWARPSDPSDCTSAWHHESEAEDAWFEKICGTCAYEAHLGVNTGGAGGVFWLSKLGEEDGLWRMANLADRGKKKVPSRQILLEPTYLFPVLLGRDVEAWRSEPSAWILMVQDPARRRGIDESELEWNAPRTLEYLRSFEAILRNRAAHRRYFSRPMPDGTVAETGPFYSMFNVGPYTLAPIKVVWNRMGNRLAAAVVSNQEGRLVLPQETHCFFGAESLDEADFLTALLNSRWVQRLLERFSPTSSKSFATPRIIHRLRIGRFDAQRELDQRLSDLGKKAREEKVLGRVMEDSLKEAIDLASAAYWEIPTFNPIASRMDILPNPGNRL